MGELMQKFLGLCVGVLLVTAAANAEALYRWVDAQGKVHYGDVPMPDANKIVLKKLTASTISVEPLSYETRRAQQKFPVTLYVANDCVDYCAQARELLQKRGIPYAEKVLVSKDEVDAFKQQVGTDRVPVLQIGENYLKGLQEQQWQAELDNAGYPKTPVYHHLNKVNPTSSIPPTSPVAP